MVGWFSGFLCCFCGPKISLEKSLLIFGDDFAKLRMGAGVVGEDIFPLGCRFSAKET